MEIIATNIQSGFDKLAGRSEKEHVLIQYSNLKWMTTFSISDKSKYAIGFECISSKFETLNLAYYKIGIGNFLKIFVDTSMSVCKYLDVKIVYKKNREGETMNFTGIDSQFEPPKSALYTINTRDNTVKFSA